MPNTEVDRDLSAAAIHVVAGIIWHPTHRDCFLITRRPEDKHLGGLWELPGGKKETAETARAALDRELEEEVGIEVITAKPFLEVLHRYPEKTIFLDVWQVSHFSGKAIAREQQAMTWVAIDQLVNYDFPEADRPVLDAVVAQSKGAAR